MKHFLALLTFYVVFQQSVTAQFQVKPGNQAPFDPVTLVSNFMTGGGINVLNVEYAGAPAAVGFFSDGASLIGLERGLVLTSGQAATAGGVIGADSEGSDFASSSNNSTATEPNLSALVNVSLFDIAYYKITFQSYNDSIQFRYVFASEEYPEYACSQFNDVFGFFLEGPGYATPTNIAMIPGSTLPVTINNIHPDNPAFPNCLAVNSQYYHNNNGSNQPPVYDGFLDPFVAVAAVEPCGVYTMTIAIADAGDAVFDSGVFIEANSFGSTPVVAASFGPGANVIPEPSTAQPVSLTFSQIPASMLPLTISFGGDAVNGIDYEQVDSTFTIQTSDTVLQFTIQPIPDSLEETIESVLVKVTNASCFIRTFDLYITDPGTVFKAAETVFVNGGIVELGGNLSGISDSTWAFSNGTTYTPTAAGVFSPINIEGVPVAALDNIHFIESVCINITHGWADDIDAYLMSPSGRFVELTTDNGANGDNYTNTCFSPEAETSITGDLPFAPASAAPFSGTFLPEGMWTDLLGSDINGTWKLLVLDDNTGFTGTVTDWSIQFKGAGLGAFQYQWSTGATTQTINTSQPGIYQVTISNDVSAFVKTYQVLPSCGFSAQTYTVCPGDSVVVNGMTFNQANPAGTLLFPVVPGCDSVVQVNLFFIPENQTAVQATICAGETYLFNNQNITSAGTYQQTLQSAAACDSVITLQLTVLPVSSSILDEKKCAEETYIFNGDTLSAAGVYTYTTTSANGCDSVITLVLSNIPALFTYISAIIEPGGSFEYMGNVFTTAGDYTIAVTSPNGCEGTVQIHIDVVSGTQMIHLDPALVAVTPNPATQQVTLQWPRDMAFNQVSVYATDQRLMVTNTISAAATNQIIDISTWPSGTYILCLQNNTGTVTRKIVKL